MYITTITIKSLQSCPTLCDPIVLLNAEYIMWNAGLDEEQAGIKIVGRNTNNLRYVDDTTLMADSEEELMRWKWKRRVKKLG